MNWSSYSRYATAACTLLLSVCALPRLLAQIDYGAFNIIVQNNASFNGGAHVHRAGYVGGNLSATANEVSFGQDHLDSGLGLAVLGNVVSNSRLSLFGSNYYLPNETVAQKLQPANPVSDVVLTDGTYIKSAAEKLSSLPGTLGDTNEVFGKLGQESSRLASLATTTLHTGASFDSNPATLDFVKNADKIMIKVVTGATNVLNLGYNSFAGISEINFSGFDASTKLVINYFANSWNTGVTLNFKTLGLDASYSDQVVWNIREVQTLTFGNGTDTFHGTILATQTDILWNANDMDGQLIAKSLTDYSSNEFHNYTYFTGDLPPIPEPSTYGLMGAAACGAFALLRRRKKAA